MYSPTRAEASAHTLQLELIGTAAAAVATYDLHGVIQSLRGCEGHEHDDNQHNQSTIC